MYIVYMALLKDSSMHHWVYKYLPKAIIPYAQLARLDRPIGWQLLLWPCLVSLLLALLSPIGIGSSIKKAIYYAILFFIGAIAMRGAGCTLNDIVDINIDKKVDRTKQRPLANGTISRLFAIIFMLLQCFIGLIILLQFNFLTIYIAFASIFFIIIYPYMKRITYWPQLFLGIVFNWGCFLGWVSLKANMNWCLLWLYLGFICWTIGYDTIYAYQDIEDDVKVGIGSTALLFKDKVYIALPIFYSLFIAFILISFYMAKISYIAYIGVFCSICHLIWQIKVLNISSPKICLKLFKSNSQVGLLICSGLLLGYGYNVFMCQL